MINVHSSYVMTKPCPCCRGDIAGTRLYGLDFCPKCDGIIDATVAVRSANRLQLIISAVLVSSGAIISIMGAGPLAMMIATVLATLQLFTLNFNGLFTRRNSPVAITSERQSVLSERTVDLFLPVAMRAHLHERFEAYRRALSADKKANEGGMVE